MLRTQTKPPYTIFCYDLSASNFSASSFFCPMLPLRPAGSSFPPVDASFSAAALFSRSESSGFRSCFLASSSSLSPRLNGSLSSASGLGAMEVSGCHFLPLPPLVLLAVFDPDFDCRSSRYSASTSSTGPDWGATGVGLKRSGFASGRVLPVC